MKKTIYIPKGETVQYERLYAERVIVDGCLRVEKGLDAKVIGGKGSIHAGKVSAKTIRIGYLDACSVMCKRLLASRVDTPELFASESVTVSCVLSACLVETPKLTVALCEVEELKAQDMVTVPARRWSVFGILFVTTLQAIVAAISAKLGKGEVMDADYTPVEEPVEEDPSTTTAHAGRESGPEPASSSAPVSASMTAGLVDEELNRIVNLFTLLRENGYTLRVIPGTPEANAPVFDAEQGRIIRPAA